ncbi:hypothetical protein MWH28_09370 [Natroniella sulfidigena]|uniref:hypothetical protein n=1 Tax=Natroniella sulfidigena TaxID=723921 RepID=UPI00200A68E5|nr:hypothetical protein [Natroniella sulfidigena]MCK8817565.1 hypothetical protein [Natroniella sulfidigena]
MKFSQNLGQIATDNKKHDLEKLSTEELKALLKKKKEIHEDIEQEMSFALNQTGIHLPGNTKEKYGKQLARLEKEINKIEELLAD